MMRNSTEMPAGPPASPPAKHKRTTFDSDNVSTAVPSPSWGDDPCSPWMTPSNKPGSLDTSMLFSGPNLNLNFHSPKDNHDSSPAASAAGAAGGIHPTRLSFPFGLLSPSSGNDTSLHAVNYFNNSKASVHDFLQENFNEPPPVMPKLNLFPSICEENDLFGVGGSGESTPTTEAGLEIPELHRGHKQEPLPLPVLGASILPEHDGCRTPPTKAPLTDADFITPAPRRLLTSPPGAPMRPKSSPLMRALQSRSHEDVEAVLKADPDAAETIFWDVIEPPISYAIKMNCDAGIIQTLVKHRAAVEAMDSNGHTPLVTLAAHQESRMEAYAFGNTVERTLAIAEVLTNAGADPFEPDFRGHRPVDIAFACGNYHLHDEWMSMATEGNAP